jgi:SAM-dependent methyltransferase
MKTRKIPEYYIVREDKNYKKKLEKYVSLCKGKDVLELGGVAGLFTDCCIEAGAKSIVSIDRFPLSPRVTKYDIIKYYKDTKKKFDIVYARHMLEHFSSLDVIHIMKETYRVLRKNGMFVIVLPNLNNIHVAINEVWREFEHVRPYSIVGIIENLEKLNFEIVKVSPDHDSWDNAWYKNIVRAIRSVLVGIPYEAPDIYVIAVKK